MSHDVDTLGWFLSHPNQQARTLTATASKIDNDLVEFVIEGRRYLVRGQATSFRPLSRPEPQVAGVQGIDSYGGMGGR